MPLTACQSDVLGLLARGLTAEETARLLGVKRATVKDHAKAVRRQLGARNTAHAVAIGLREGLIQP
jgi:DNA-binding CsgD family transcriptional regulator